MDKSFYNTKAPLDIPISIFKHARDRVPENKSPTLEALVVALTRFKTRDDIAAKAGGEISELDNWLARLAMSNGIPPNDLTRYAPTWARLWREASLNGSLSERVDRFRLQEKKKIWSRHKTTIPAWSPTVYKPGATRASANVLSLSCLVLDYDEDVALDAIQRIWADWFYIAHTSWSHEINAPRYRWVIPLASPVPAEAWERGWAWAKKMDRTIDRSCKNKDRIYFIPAVKSKAAPRWTYVNRAEHWLDLNGEHVPKIPKPRPVGRIGPRPPITVPAGEAERVARFRMDRDPATRRRVAQSANAQIRGSGADERATHVRCPGCGRLSVWWYIDPGRKRTASCNHIGNSCGWYGRLWEVI